MTWIAQLRCHGSSESPPALTDSGSKPPPTPALEQNSAIGPNLCSVSSMTWDTSFSLPTSHLKAAPLMAPATARAALGSMSATTTLAAPARWKASHSARPIPLPPPVTTTTLPATCMAPSPSFMSLFYYRSLQDDVEHRRVVAGGAAQHKAVPDRVLETQPLPGVEHHAESIEHTARDDEAYRHGRQRLDHGVIEHHAAPAHGEVKPDREAVEPSGEFQLQHDAGNGRAPHTDQQHDSQHAFLHLHDERRIGRRDQHIDGGMVEAAQHPFGPRHRPEIVGRRQAEHGQQARDIDRGHHDIERGGIDRSEHDQDGGGDEAKADADNV